ncbi:MAG: hypothetical protein ACLQQ4_12610 [Bacteroidia bacterium]
MPKGILARLIVKLNRDIFEDKYWRFGVILQYDDTKAIVRERYFDSKITIELSGKNAIEYLFVIRKAISEINRDFNKIEVDEMVPCKCTHCLNVEQVFYYPFNLLKRYDHKGIKRIRCDLSLEEVIVTNLISDIFKEDISKDRVIACENKNVELYKLLQLENVIFFPERDSTSVFIQVKTSERHGIRDRDFLLDSEIHRIQKKYPTFYILNYYCIENYLYHPDNIDELKLKDFKKTEYVNDIVSQKNTKKSHIISIYKNARNSYQEFKVDSENLRVRKEEEQIINYLDSDNIETFFKAFSMKDYHSKGILSKYNLKNEELASTNWFKEKISKIITPPKLDKIESK